MIVQQTKNFTVDVTFDASARFDVIAPSEDEAKRKAAERFNEILVVYDCDRYEFSIEIEEEKPLRSTKARYSVDVTLNFSYTTYIVASNGKEAEERAKEQSEEFYDLEFYDFRSSPIDVAFDVSAKVQED